MLFLHESMLIIQNILNSNSKPLNPDINAHAKFEENQSKIFKREIGNETLTDGHTDGRSNGIT